MATIEESIGAHIGEVLAAANALRGDEWYEPADLVLRPVFTGSARRPRLIYWHATLGGVEVDGGATAIKALIALKNAFANRASRAGARR